MIRNATGTLPPITCKRFDDGKSVLVVSPTHAEAKAITAAIRQELREAGVHRGRGPRIHAAGAGRYQRSGTLASSHLPAGRCHPVPPECQGRFYQRRPADGHRSGDGAAFGSTRNSRSTGRRRSRWRRATASGSPARSRRSTASTRSRTAWRIPLPAFTAGRQHAAR